MHEAHLIIITVITSCCKIGLTSNRSDSQSVPSVLCRIASVLKTYVCALLSLLSADTYLTASHLLMTTAANDAQQAMTCKAWHDQPRLPERLHRYFARAEAAMGIARTAALLQADDPAQGQVVSSSSDKEIQQQQQQQQQARIEQLNANLAFIEENSGSLQLERVQNAPPIYNQMLLVPDKESTTYCQSCQVGLAAFSKAAQRLPDEWEFQLNLAKLLRKSGGSAQQVLWHLAKACCLAKLHNKGLIEPLYQLHALRLKLSAQDSADLELLGRYSFAPPVLAEPMQGDDQSSPQLALTDTDNTQEEADAAMQQASEHTQALQTALPAASTATQNPVWSDAMGALSWCLEHSKAGNHETYHKVRYRQAHALYSQGQHDVALQVLQPLFRKKGSNSFSINMYMISNGSSSKVSS